MKQGEVFVVIGLILAILAVLTVAFYIFTNKPPEITSGPSTVIKVIDGDTFDYYNGITVSRVRLLCVDTPEKGEPGYEEAKEFLEGLVLGKIVTLEASIVDQDQYERYLRYAYTGSVFVNKEVIKKGYGVVLAIPPENCSMFDSLK